MVKTRMVCPGINDIRKSHLRNATQSLEIFMLHQIENQLVGYGNKTIDGIVNDFELGNGFQTLTLN